MTISPNFGEIGPPQLGHFRDVAPEGARTSEEGVTVCLAVFNPVLVPHLAQNVASSGSWAPQLRQYKSFHQTF
jgi:hypothetical protein